MCKPTRDEVCTLERFLEVVPITPEEERAEGERFAAARRERKMATSAEPPPAA